ncbi:hypothetical protein AB0J80_35445 [Actinoplanes sp. NPDC049548]|uniref:hypothetical protein n=1 Tax=Actinoplanes sp. NPDC049548 TaxID=3155152 RepID=UPI00342892B8
MSDSRLRSQAARLREPALPPAWLRTRAVQADLLAAKETLDVLHPAVDAGNRMGREYDERNWSRAEQRRYAGLLAGEAADRNRAAAAVIRHGTARGRARHVAGTVVAAPQRARSRRR